MKAQILKIAGVKSEKEFYKKFPTEEAFLKKHGKELAKLKKAAVGDVIEYTDVEVGNNKPVIDENIQKNVLGQFDQFKDRAFELGVKSMTTDEEKEMYEYKAKVDAMYNKQNSGGGGLMDFLGSEQGMADITSIFGEGGGEGGGKGMSSMISEMGGMMKKGGKVEKFTPHMMYDPKTKKGKKAMTYKEHLALKKKGWGHEAPKAQDGKNVTEKVSDEELNNMFAKLKQRKTFNDLETRQLKNKIDSLKLKQKLKKKTPKAFMGFGGGGSGGATTGGGAVTSEPSGFSKFMQGASDVFNSDAVQNFGIPIVSDAIKIGGQIKQQKDALKDLKQMTEVTGIARAAAMTKPEEIERDYVRPEDIQNTGEEFFPIYGVGTNVLAKNGATLFNNPDYAPINNINKAKTFMHGGYLPKANAGFNSFNPSTISYGGGAWAQVLEMHLVML